MKKRVPQINIITICFLAALLIISSFKCIRVTHYASPFAVLDGLSEPVVEYENAQSAILVILISLQVVSWFFNRKIVRIVGIVLSSVTTLIYIFLPVGMSVVNMLNEKISDSPKAVYELLPLGYVLIGISAITVILTVVSLIRMNRVTTKNMMR